MRRFLKLLSVVPVLALGLAACDSSEKLTSPDAAFKVQSQTATELRAAPAAPTAPVVARTAHEAVVDADVTEFGGLDGTVTTSSLSAGINIIGAEGGVVRVWNMQGALVAQLVVPAGAVARPALFTVRISGNDRVRLTATEHRFNDIGAAGLAKPVRIYYNPTNARNGRSAGIRTDDPQSMSGVLSKKSSAEGDDPNMPPGEGWIWIETELFTGWIIIGS